MSTFDRFARVLTFLGKVEHEEVEVKNSKNVNELNENKKSGNFVLIFSSFQLHLPKQFI